MKANDYRAMKTAELETKCKDLKEELFKLKFQLSLGQLTNTAKVSEVKRDIARINTVLTERLVSEKEGK
jgi:large subunit ribosomal protein L29